MNVRKASNVAHLILFVLLLVIGSLVISEVMSEYKACSESNGELVRGLFWFTCVH